MKLPSIPSRDDLASQARGLASQAASGAAKAADTVSRAAADTGRAAARTAAQTSQRLGVDQLPGLSGLSRLAQDDGAPVDVDAGPRITGTPFARTLATAFAAHPHTRSAGSYLMGTSPMRTGLRMGGPRAQAAQEPRLRPRDHRRHRRAQARCRRAHPRARPSHSQHHAKRLVTVLQAQCPQST